MFDFQFHLQQAKLRSKIRIEDGRGNHIFMIVISDFISHLRLNFNDHIHVFPSFNISRYVIIFNLKS